MNIFFRKKSNAESITHGLIKALGARVNSETISQSLQDHPYYPSMLSIVDCLVEWNLDHEIYNINRADYDRDDLIFPFLAHLKEDGGRFILVQHIDDYGVRFSDEAHTDSIISEKEFLNRWDGIALWVKRNDNSGEKNYIQNRLRYFLKSLTVPLGIALALTIFFFCISLVSFSWPYLLLSLIKLVGLCVSVLLLMQSLNSNNPLIQNLCTFGKKNDCNAILKTDAAKVTSWLSWSEIGFFYFTGSLLLLLVHPTSINLLAWLNVLALPYIIYSITYQYRAKSWCVLCCTVQALLMLEFIVAKGFGLLDPQFFTFSLSAFSFILLTVCFLSPIINWALLKSFFLDAGQLKPLKQQLKQFKYNEELFNQALISQPKYVIDDELMPIVLGNSNGKIVVTMVTNPYCGPCAKAHETLEKWLEIRDDLKVLILFSTTNHINDDAEKVAQHITALSLFTDRKFVGRVLNDWYKQTSKSFDTWAGKYPVTVNGSIAKAIENQKKWCKIVDINFTPTILVNGYKLPEPYRLEDITYLLS